MCDAWELQLTPAGEPGEPGPFLFQRSESASWSVLHSNKMWIRDYFNDENKKKARVVFFFFKLLKACYFFERDGKLQGRIVFTHFNTIFKF